MLEAVVDAVGDRTVVVEAGEDLLDLVDDVVDAGHVEVGFLLSGERRVGQVFGCCRGAHRHGDVAAAIVVTQLPIGDADVGVECGMQRRIGDPATDLATGGGQRLDVLDVERGQPVEDALFQVVVGNERLERLGGRRKPAGH